MPSRQRNHTAVIRWLLFVYLLYSGSSLEAQIEAPTPVPTQEAPSKSNGTTDDSELKIHNYQLKHAKAAEVLKLFKQLHGGENTATVDERTNSIVFLANETNARELLESLALLDGDAPHPIIPPTPVVQGSSPQAPVPAKSQPRPAKSKPAGPFRKFTFKHAKVADVVKILRELTGANIDNENMEGFAVDERTNSVIWKVDEWVSQHWEETLLTLDGESSTSTTQKTPSPYAPTPASGSVQPTQTFTFSMGLERGGSLESLKQRYNELEQQAHQLADKLKQSKSPSEPGRTELKAAVRKSFEARQALQRAELADLAQRMQNMQQSIDMRDKLADKVVQRRVEDLLDPNLKWEVTRTSNESTRSISKEDSINQNTITSSQEMQAALQGTWNVRAFQAGDQGDDRLSQVVIRGDLLLMHTIVNEKVLGVSPWKLVWPNAERPYELGVIWDPNSNAESNSEPARIAYDGKSFQLAWGENPNAICPGENIAYIDCVRGNIVDRSTATADTEGAADSNLQSDSIPIFNTPQELLDAVEQHGKSGSYGDFVTLFNDEGVRDLAGSLLMSAMMQTSMDELSRQQTTGGLAEVDPGTVAVRKVLQRWLPQSLSADQREYVGKGLSAMMSSIGGTSPDQAAMKEFVISMRKSVEGIADHHKFCIELMQAYEKLTTKPFVYFGNADQKNEWQLSQFGERAIATLIDGSPGMATTITLQQASGDWRISSLFNELVEMTKEDERVARPITPAMEMQQRLQGEWDVKVMGYSPDMHVKQPYQAVVRGQLFLLQCMEDGKVIGTSTWKMIWPKADHPDVVDIVWDPNNNSDEYCAPGRITCDGKSFQVAWRSDDSISGPAIRPTELCSGEGISYFECVRKQPTDPSPTSTSSDAPAGPKYSSHPISWWLDSYWDNATASPRTTENETQEYVASEAIRKLRELPECKAAIEAALTKWFASVEHEVNEIQLTRATKCIVFAAGPKNQKLAVDYLFEIAKRVPINPGEENLGKWIDCWDDELDKAVKELVLNDELATQIADRLQTGNSAQRRFAVTFLLNRGASKQTDTPDQTEANAWFRSHDKLFYPAFEAALQDSIEAIRMFALIVLTGIDPRNSQLPFQLKTVVESDPSTQVRCVAIQLLCSKELASTIEAQSVELQPLLMKALEADSSVDVRDAALGALMAMDKDSELVHATLLEWARCTERLRVENALSLILRNHEAGDRPQSIDELIELLSDPEWGNTVEVKQSNWSTYHRWARQYAIAILGQYAEHAHRAIPTLEAELARNNKDTLSFATEALDRVRGYCPDLPIDKLQGEWEFVSMQKPEGSSPFYDFQTSSDQQVSSVIMISGTQLKLGQRVLAELSHYRSGSRQGVALLLDPDGKKRHCHGWYKSEGCQTQETPLTLTLEVSELHDDPSATQATKQSFEFRRVKK